MFLVLLVKDVEKGGENTEREREIQREGGRESDMFL